MSPAKVSGLKGYIMIVSLPDPGYQLNILNLVFASGAQIAFSM